MDGPKAVEASWASGGDPSERRVAVAGKQYLTEALDDEVAKNRATLKKEVLKFHSRLSSARDELAEESNQCPTLIYSALSSMCHWNF